MRHSVLTIELPLLATEGWVGLYAQIGKGFEEVQAQEYKRRPYRDGIGLVRFPRARSNWGTLTHIAIFYKDNILLLPMAEGPQQVGEGECLFVDFSGHQIIKERLT